MNRFLLAILICILAGTAQTQTIYISANPPPVGGMPGKMIDIGGRRLHMLAPARAAPL